MYYHVKISNKSAKGSNIGVPNLSWGLVEHRVVNPYRLGQPITLEGTTIYSNEIQGIKLFETDDTVAKIGSLDAIVDLLPGGYSFSSLEHDITDKWIDGPPGIRAPVDVTQCRPTDASPEPRLVFVVHGRNRAARKAIFQFLRALDLHPMEWTEAVDATGRPTPYNGEILDAAFPLAQAIVVLFTPDDKARLLHRFRSGGNERYESELTGQARPNVIFEAGMAMGRNQDRTVLVELGDLRPFSDIAGRNTIRIDEGIQWREDLANRLKLAGCPERTVSDKEGHDCIDGTAE